MTLEGRAISFRYQSGNHLILNRVDISIESGERVGLIAPSGFGKTTLCKILAGYERADSGQVLLGGKPLDSCRGYCPVQMIWQHPEQAVNPRLRMRDVLAEGDDVEQRVVSALGIEPGWMNRFPGELSAGELQRFCIARALGRRTRFILADEISAMLDLITQSQLWNFLMEETGRRKIGMLAVSHSPSLLEQVCTRCVNLEEIH